MTLVAPLLTASNLDEVVARVAFLTKAEAEHVVASLQPREPPKPGVRQLSGTAAPAREVEPPGPQTASTTLFPAVPASNAEDEGSPPSRAGALPERLQGEIPRPSERRQPVEVRPVAAEAWSLRVTMTAQMKAELDTLASLLSHKSGSDLAAVLHEALRCAIEKHGKRRGAVAPTRERAAPVDDARAASRDRGIPAAVRHEVWLRDGGCCAWVSKDIHRCASRWKLELDHIVPVALGGPSTVENLRLTCRRHNVFHAEKIFGREHMAAFSVRRPN